MRTEPPSAEEIAAARALLEAIDIYRWLAEWPPNMLISTGDITEHLGLNPKTVRNWCEQGLIWGAAYFGKPLGWRMPPSSMQLFFATHIRNGAALVAEAEPGDGGA